MVYHLLPLKMCSAFWTTSSEAGCAIAGMVLHNQKDLGGTWESEAHKGAQSAEALAI